MPSYGGRLGGGAVCPLCRETASSEAEMSHPFEGRSATLERGGDESPARGQIRYPRARRRLVTRSRADPLPSSEAEISHPLVGGFATLERGGDCPAGPRGSLERGGGRPAGLRGMRMGRMLSFFESFPFFQMGSRPWAFAGLVAFTGICVF